MCVKKYILIENKMDDSRFELSSVRVQYDDMGLAQNLLRKSFWQTVDRRSH